MIMMMLFSNREEKVPVVVDNLVTFSGDVPHSTIVKSGEVYLLGPFDERFSPIAPSSVVHVKSQNRFRQRKLDDAGDGDGITFESTNSTNSTDECSLVLDMLGALQDSLANPHIILLNSLSPSCAS
jgi:hypothetical protein